MKEESKVRKRARIKKVEILIRIEGSRKEVRIRKRKQ
jgi:hypothetical protein